MTSHATSVQLSFAIVLEKTGYSNPSALFDTVTGHLTDTVTAKDGANLTSSLAATSASLAASGDVKGVSFLQRASVLASAWVAPSSFLVRQMGDWSRSRVSWYGYGYGDPQYYLLRYCDGNLPPRNHYLSFVEGFAMVLVVCLLSLTIPEVCSLLSCP